MDTLSTHILNTTAVKIKSYTKISKPVDVPKPTLKDNFNGQF